jgi:hypothetical protein
VAYVWCAAGVNATHKGSSTLMSQVSSALSRLRISPFRLPCGSRSCPFPLPARGLGRASVLPGGRGGGVVNNELDTRVCTKTQLELLHYSKLNSLVFVCQKIPLLSSCSYLLHSVQLLFSKRQVTGRMRGIGNRTFLRIKVRTVLENSERH